MGIAAVVIAAHASGARAQEQVLEEVERLHRVQPQGGVVTVLERAELERQQWRTLADALEHVPGLHVTSAGGRAPAELSVRGTSQHQVLFLLDGIEVTDPAQLHDAATSAFRSSGTAIPHLLLDDIERIEVWRGPQSARFGSGAVGGVVRLVTRRGGGEPAATAWTEFGGFGTTQSTLRLRGGAERVDYTLGWSQLHSRGVSASPDEVGGHERDGYDNGTLASRVDLQITPDLRLGLTGRYIRTENELDVGARMLDGAVLAGDSHAGFGHTRELLVRAEAELRLLDGRWRQTLAASLADYDSRERDAVPLPRSVFNPFQGRVFLPEPPHRLSADGRRLQVGWRSELDLAPQQTLVLGLETERETMDAFQAVDELFAIPTSSTRSAHARTNALFAEQRFQLGALEGALAARLDDRTGLATQPSALLSLQYVLAGLGTRFHGSLGSAFRAPALDVEGRTVHRYREAEFPFRPFPEPAAPGAVIAVVPGAGDADAERSHGFELGIAQSFLGDRAALDVTYFDGRVRHVEIDRSVPVANPLAIVRVDDGEVAVRGVETSLELRPVDPLVVSLYHTYTSAEERSSDFRPGADRLLQPKHELGLRLAAEVLRDTTLALDVHYVGRRRDLREPREAPRVFPENSVVLSDPSVSSLGGYTVVDVAASHTFLERYTVFARVENLFDREYEDRRFVAQPGIAGYVGVRVEF